jgi:hypothetical protein
LFFDLIFAFLSLEPDTKEILNLFPNCNYYNAVINMENLENEVIKVLKTFQKNRAQWYKIRNALLTEHSELKTLDDMNSLNVKLTRSLKQLEEKGYVIRKDLGHKKIFYQLATELSEEPEFFPIFYGDFNPLNEMPTYEEFKKKLFEHLNRDDWYKKRYEEFKRHWESFQKTRTQH